MKKNMKNYFRYPILLTLCIVILNTAKAQIPFTHSENNPGTLQNFNYSICESNGNFYTAGTEDNSKTGTLDISVTCRNKHGFVIWNKTYDFNGKQDFSGKIRPTPDGVIITGTTGGLYDTKKVAFLLRLNVNGNIINQATYDLSTLKANLYGLDVVYEPNRTPPTNAMGTFMIVGMGVKTDGTNSLFEGKFGFVMQISNDLQTINWSKYYTRDPSLTGGWFDCINNIDRYIVSGAIRYHLTGSQSDFSTRFYGADQAVLNMMIDPSGTVIWNKPYRETDPSFPWSDRQYARGINSLLNGTNLFLLSSSSYGHSEAIAKIDVYSGTVLSYNLIIPITNGNTGFNMYWSDPSNSHIVMPGILPTGSAYGDFMVNATPGIPSLAPLWERKYNFGFVLSDLLNINYDYNLKPLIDSTYAFPLFFVPTMAVRNDLDTPSGHMLVSYMNATGNPMNNFLMGTFSNGDIQANAACIDTPTYWQADTLTAYNLPVGVWTSLGTKKVAVTVSIDSPTRNVYMECNSYMGYKTTSIENTQALSDKKFELYPNPSHDVLHLSIPADIKLKSIRVTSVLGNVFACTVSSYNGPISDIDISSLAPGFYILKVEGETNIQTFKFIKQ
ncbi:MAG: T9SS type A sorting domain-containing protein [Bacteroidetes bacterium]|nr:T9SS type A sorting domain-containing protein [Bacteroidota bacterium]